MTPEQFVFWLRGYFASGNPGDFTRGDWRTVADVLAQVAAFRTARQAEMAFPPLQQADDVMHVDTRGGHAY